MVGGGVTLSLSVRKSRNVVLTVPRPGGAVVKTANLLRGKLDPVDVLPVAKGVAPVPTFAVVVEVLDFKPSETPSPIPVARTARTISEMNRQRFFVHQPFLPGPSADAPARSCADHGLKLFALGLSLAILSAQDWPGRTCSSLAAVLAGFAADEGTPSRSFISIQYFDIV